MQEHVNDPKKLPILIFPEGTCINNTSIASVIYPIAMKYDARLGDAFGIVHYKDMVNIYDDDDIMGNNIRTSISYYKPIRLRKISQSTALSQNALSEELINETQYEKRELLEDNSEETPDNYNEVKSRNSKIQISKSFSCMIKEV
uniref:Phospholipid/glycerol acyltransferase domain-containing protein n=1 Tax=Strongyloides stercoralis TaxID=6248 RepID=A0AAF5DPT7_STRER